ncbi:Vesicular-fusion protein sec18 [Cyphellophora attinorum]|uniref:Vesicular-fusion protein SEC18 n=1 Tax=Cyphellophora attinorum TaxID=1664694 RepID=A0A0N0NHK5_9EURO|nr:Vesicular-fusion protein sec18 [Phialophora attinorum]KPI34791.1 Vesicular-fusion protein sec18 [Phialophora attinorum]
MSYERDLFGGRGRDTPPRAPPSYNQRPPTGGLPPRPQQQYPQQPQQPMRSSRQNGPPGGRWSLSPVKSPDNSFTFRNLVAVSTQEFQPSRDGSDLLLMVNGMFVVSAKPIDQFQPGTIGLSEPQRSWMGIALTDQLQVEIYDPFSQGGQAYLGSMDLEVGFAAKSKTPQTPYDQDDLAKEVSKVFQNQVFAPGQRFLMDLRSVPLNITVKTVELMDLNEKASGSPPASDPRARGILTPHTQMNFFKDARTPINIKASSRRPAANAIIAPDFKFEDMGIGGLDAEFSTIFRRAFASRIFPPGLVEKLGIQHVKGMLLFGPPGTGKTLIARQIGKMLNAREPKVINGPEVLNKYVGQSEENIRKLFADAEKEYKEKGDESGLHIIIFDELDAVCKQRGSGAGGGTGVGDSVVNQLLSKLDGVDQLNNILLIGMTNRKDMIDDALLRPGRLEVHMEISLPDEHGRQQILNIHTTKMRTNGVMDSDVDLAELAKQTKNFSGAEIGGLVKSATSFAFNRHVKVGTMAGVSDDVTNMKVNRADFEHALEEVKPAFGVSEEELGNCLRGGILHYSPYIQDILQEGSLFVSQVRNVGSTPVFSVCLHGAPKSGKTALAAKIAIDSGYPFVKLISPEDMVGMSEGQKVAQLTKVFTDAYKSTLSAIVVDSLEIILEWVPIGPRFSNPIFQTLVTLLRKQPPQGRQLLILATTSDRSIMQQLGIWQDFSAEIAVPTVASYQELEYVMRESRVFSGAEIESAIREIQEITGARDVGVGIKRVLLAIETAKQDADKASRFAGVMGRAISQR